MQSQITNFITKLSNGTLLDVSEIQLLLAEVSPLLHNEPNVIHLDQVSVNVIGDIHGDISSLNHIFGVSPINNEDQSWVFLGDYVDRGSFSVPIIQMLFCLKCLYPTRVYLLRGNHECRPIGEIYGFLEELKTRYDQDIGTQLFEQFTTSFYEFPLAVIIGDRILGVHAGLSESMTTIQDIEALDRFHEVPEAGLMTDLLWSDPHDQNGWMDSPRGCSKIWGSDISQSFCQTNNLDFIVRSHQLVMDGYLWNHNNNILTVFSSANYCMKCENAGSFLQISPSLETAIIEYPASTNPSIEVENQYLSEFTFSLEKLLLL